jgi:hypothetical protein
MERNVAKRVSTAALAGLLGAGVVYGAADLIQATGADRVVDRGYDRAIAVATDGGAGRTDVGLLRLAGHKLDAAYATPAAATEHVWLTQSAQHVHPTAIGSTVGARFTLSGGGVEQSLEVVDISEIAGNAAKMLMISCKIVGEVSGDGKSPAAAEGHLVRFIVDADPSANRPVHPIRLPRLL